VSAENPTGTINNSELELAGIIMSTHLAAQLTDHPHPNIWCASDNMAAVAWANNGSTLTHTPSALLLRLLGTLSYRRRFNLFAVHIAGTSNVLADTLSRHFDLFWPHLLHATVAPMAPQQSLRIVHLPSDTLSDVISALSRQIWRTDCPQATLPHNPPLGLFGNVSATTSARTLSLQVLPTQYHSSNYLPAAIAQAPWLPAGMQ
jgi:hypothetical protein